MKIWNSYGSEHSMNLVIIGRFKKVEDAEGFEGLAQNLTNFLRDNKDFQVEADRFDTATSEYLRERNLFALSIQQLSHFLGDLQMSRRQEEIRIRSDDDINGLVSLLVHQGAKVEVFSAHDYPEENK